MVLDALLKIKDEVDTTLAFRRSCREGVCGSCAFNIDGTNTLACIKPIDEVRGDVNIYPLPHMAVVKDLVVDLSVAYAQYAAIKPWLQADSAPADGERAPEPGRARRAGRVVGVASFAFAARRAARAIGGTVNRTWARRSSCRPIAGSPIPATRRRPSGSTSWTIPSALYRCHTIMNCTSTCPKDLNPGKAIAEIKKLQAQRR